MNASESEQRSSILEDLRAALPSQLPGYLTRQRWFGGKARQIQSVEIVDIIPFLGGRPEGFFLFARVEYATGPGDTYVLPMARTTESSGLEDAKSDGSFLTVRRRQTGSPWVLTEALENDEFLLGLLQMTGETAVLQGTKGEIRATPTNVFRDMFGSSGMPLKPRLLKGEQSNSSIVYGDRFILKIFRRLDEGMNPDLEIGLFLTEKAHFANIPPVAGSFEYSTGNGQAATLGILQGFVPNQGDAWRFTLQSLAHFWREVSQTLMEPPPPPLLNAETKILTRPLSDSIPSLDSYLGHAALLAERTAEMHQALSSDISDPSFALEPYSDAFQRTLEKSICELTERNFSTLRQKKDELPQELRVRAEELIRREPDVLQEVRSVLSSPISAMRIRIHGDYHLGQILYTGSDFMIIDFEGEPARPLAERRIKRSPLQDVAGMLRSFHYAAFASWMAPLQGTPRPGGTADTLISWAETWSAWVTSRFINSYLEHSGQVPYLPSNRDELFSLLRLHLFEKAIYELGYELNNRPAWVGIPLAGISALLTHPMFGIRKGSTL